MMWQCVAKSPTGWQSLDTRPHFFFLCPSPPLFPHQSASLSTWNAHLALKLLLPMLPHVLGATHMLNSHQFLLPPPMQFLTNAGSCQASHTDAAESSDISKTMWHAQSLPLAVQSGVHTRCDFTVNSSRDVLTSPW